MSNAIKHDGGKSRFSLLPWDALREVVAVREYGVRTYGSEHCWQDVEPRRYVDALLRHGAEIVENGIHSRDAESGLLHTAHIACNALFLVWCAKRAQQKAAEPKPAADIPAWAAAARAAVDAFAAERPDRGDAP